MCTGRSIRNHGSAQAESPRIDPVASQRANLHEKLATDTARSARSSEATPEISITFQKTRVQLLQMSLHRVMHPLLWPTASTV
jgi:hypothetical protein